MVLKFYFLLLCEAHQRTLQGEGPTAQVVGFVERIHPKNPTNTNKCLIMLRRGAQELSIGVEDVDLGRELGMANARNVSREQCVVTLSGSSHHHVLLSRGVNPTRVSRVGHGTKGSLLLYSARTPKEKLPPHALFEVQLVDGDRIGLEGACGEASNDWVYQSQQNSGAPGPQRGAEEAINTADKQACAVGDVEHRHPKRQRLQKEEKNVAVSSVRREYAIILTFDPSQEGCSDYLDFLNHCKDVADVADPDLHAACFQRDGSRHFTLVNYP